VLIQEGFVFAFFTVRSSLASSALAHAPSGALFTTVADGSEVNANIYALRTSCISTESRAAERRGRAGLDDDTIRVPVTEPSREDAGCPGRGEVPAIRRIGGIITAVCPRVPASHRTGRRPTSADGAAHAYAIAQQRGVYKAWVVRLGPSAGCAALGVPTAGGRQLRPERRQHHGFIPRHKRPTTSKSADQQPRDRYAVHR